MPVVLLLLHRIILAIYSFGDAFIVLGVISVLF